MKKKSKHKEKAERLNLLFRMVDLNIPLDVCWVIGKTMKKYKKKKGKFNVKNAVKITCKKDELNLRQLQYEKKEEVTKKEEKGGKKGKKKTGKNSN